MQAERVNIMHGQCIEVSKIDRVSSACSNSLDVVVLQGSDQVNIRAQPAAGATGLDNDLQSRGINLGVTHSCFLETGRSELDCFFFVYFVLSEFGLLSGQEFKKVWVIPLIALNGAILVILGAPVYQSFINFF